MINSLVENMSQSMSTNSDGYGDKFDEMIRLLAEISSNTSNGDTGKTTSGVGSGDKSMGSNSIVSKAGKRTATQKRQDAMNKAKYKLQSLSNGSNTGMGRSDLRSIWEQVSKPSY